MNCSKISPKVAKKLRITPVNTECPLIKHKIRICPDAKPNAPAKENEAVSKLEKLAVWTAGIATALFLIVGGYVGVNKIIKGIKAGEPPVKEDPALIEKSVRECREQARKHPIRHAFESCLSGRIPEGATFERLLKEAKGTVDAGNVLRILQ